MELLDAALVAAAFDCDVSLLFRGEGVCSLLPNQGAHAVGQRSFSKMLRGLADYDIEKLYACSESLQRHCIHPNSELGIQSIAASQQQQLMAHQGAVIGASQ